MTPEQKLWQSVVLRAALDATSNPSSSSDDYIAQKNADAWMRTGGRDFREVCGLAGLDPDFIKEAYVGGRINAELLRSKELQQ